MNVVIENKYDDNKTFLINGNEYSFDKEIDLTEAEVETIKNIKFVDLLGEEQNKFVVSSKEPIEEVDYISLNIMLEEIELYNSVRSNCNGDAEAIEIYKISSKRIADERSKADNIED